MDDRDGRQTGIGRAGGATTAFIRWFVARYQVNMDEAAQPDIAQYPSFNAFFTRELRDGARPMAQADLVCPVDGAISQCGAIAQDQIFQAKGHSYSTTALLGAMPSWPRSSTTASSPPST